jgi:hypothetical protein
VETPVNAGWSAVLKREQGHAAVENVHDEAADRFVPSAAFAAVDTCAANVVFAASGSVGVSVAVLELAS